MKKYLNADERNVIGWDLRHGFSIRKIAKRLQRAKSTVAYEVKKCGNPYFAEKARLITQNNLKQRGAKSIAGQYRSLLDFINHNYDKKSCSLPMLLKIWQAEHSDTPSLATLYNWISKGVFDFGYDQILRPHKKRQEKIRTWKRMIGRPISKRRLDFPLVEGEFGHWEGDLVAGRQHHGGYVLTMVERQSRFGITRLLAKKDADTTLKTLKSVMLSYPKYPFKSLTFDNGLEFTKAGKLEKWGVKVYHTFPYTASQRGRNENWNGILRRWYPKGTNLLKITETELAGVTNTINDMIRKKLDWKSAREKFLIAIKNSDNKIQWKVDRPINC